MNEQIQLPQAVLDMRDDRSDSDTWSDPLEIIRRVWSERKDLARPVLSDERLQRLIETATDLQAHEGNSNLVRIAVPERYRLWPGRPSPH